MSTLRVSNIEAKADPSGPTVNEKVKITNSNGDVMFQLDGATSGITTVGINTTTAAFTVDGDQNFNFVGIVTAASFSGNLTGNVTGPGTCTFDGSVGIGTDNPQATLHLFGSGGAATGNEGIRLQTLQATGGNWISFNDTSRKGYFGYKETSDDGIYLVNEENSHIVLGTNGLERFRIASDGAIGIAGTIYGTSGQVLTSQGSGSSPQWATPSTSGNTSTTLSTTSTSTSLDGISNSANIVTIGFNNIRVTTNDFLAVQLRSGGSNVTGSFYNYGSKLNTSNTGTGDATIYFVVIENNWASNTDRLDGTFTLVRSASNTWVASWTAVTRNNSNAFWGGGDYGAALANLNGIRLLSGANFVGGQFSLTWS